MRDKLSIVILIYYDIELQRKEAQYYVFAY